MSAIVIKGAREHNLKNVNVRIPRNALVVITGLSGSGKSSLAFDTIYSEGQRRYLESLSSYARQFLDKMKKADIDYISGLSPTISIEQRTSGTNPRSTVGTVTEVYDYLRLLYAKAGAVHCYRCGQPITSQSRGSIVDAVMNIGERFPIRILAPMVRGRKGEYKELLAKIKKQGFAQVCVDGVMRDLADSIVLRKNSKHTIEVLVDEVFVEEKNRSRIESSIVLALDLTEGSSIVRSLRDEKEYFFSESMSCPQCNISVNALAPNMFSFNSPYGACSECHGLGRVSRITSSLIIKDPTKSLLKGAINKELYFGFNKYMIQDLVTDLMSHFSLELHTPYCKLPQEVQDAFFWGIGPIDGLLSELRTQMARASSENMRNKLRAFIQEDVCPSCHGMRLKKESLGVSINGLHIAEVCALPIEKVQNFFASYELSGTQHTIVEPILKEIRERLSFLVNIGVGYLSLDRSVATLGGGELQRVKLGAQIGVGLSGVLYVLDEPSIGLHPRDTDKLINALCALRALRNTVIVVEHDEETIRQADYVIDLGPGAGEYGGEIVGRGTFEQFIKSRRSLTAQYLRGEKKIALPLKRRSFRESNWLRILGASEHNLKGIDVSFPLGLLTCVTGVSGSGKSTLIHDTLSRALHNKRWKTKYSVGKHAAIEGDENIDKVIEIDQTPIGRTPRSNPATYIDLFVHIRKLFASLSESKIRNYTQGRFSFNVKGGRCEACRGDGVQRLEMSLLPDVYVVCDVCNGKRYNEQTLEICYKGKNIYDVLDMSVVEALSFFDAIPHIREKLEVLDAVGLSYIRLGQASTTLSGGEAQRIKLAAELAKKATGKTLYLLDEPTTGLHFHDINHLMKALMSLCETGNTVIVIEHNLDVVKMADYIVDLGPDGGEKGGHLVATGAPEDIVKVRESVTGAYLKNYLK